MTTTAIPTKHMTLEEFLALPEDGPYAELKHGEFVEMVRPSFEHNDLVLTVAYLLREHARTNGLGLVGHDVLVILDESRDLACAPDIFFLSQNGNALLRDGRVWGAPDLLVEVTSPHTEARDRGAKMDDYAAAGVEWYWIIDPDSGLVEEFQLSEEALYRRTRAAGPGTPFRPTLFPGLEIDLAEARGPRHED